MSNYIVRNNFIYDASGSGIQWVAWRNTDVASNNKVYNNVFFRNGHRSTYAQQKYGMTLLSSSGRPVQGNVVLNNVFHQNAHGDIIYGGTSAAAQDIRTNWWSGNGDPGFVDPRLPSDPSDSLLPDLQVQPGSPCIDAGEFLTTITSSDGSGTAFQVADAGFFHDGFNISYGDTIQLEGQTTTTQIIEINYDTNQITVDKSISWSRGDGVSLPYNGHAPDLGAVEYGMGDADDISPPSNLRIVD